MELKYIFDEDAENYDKYRPDYPQELFDDIAGYAGLQKNAKLLEIGIGTGKASSVFLNSGYNVTGIDIGGSMCGYVKKKFAAFDNLNIIENDFLMQPFREGKFRLIYSATAFHWLDEAKSYRKILQILEENGTLALFWNRPDPNNEADESNLAGMAVYAKYRTDQGSIKKFSENDCILRSEEMKRAGFKDVEYRLYNRIRTLTADEYVGLITTYSDHRALPKNTQKAFERDMRDAVNAAGGIIKIYDTLDLYLGRKA